MSRQPLWRATVAALLVAALAAAQQPKKDDKQVVDTKGQKGTPAATVDFNKQLGLPFPSLGTLGSRIDAARRAPDPVALAHAANELAVAEQVSGKQASVTSAAVLKEAAELARLRREAAELKALLHVTKQVTGAQETVGNLKADLADAEQRHKQETEAVKRGAATGEAQRTLFVNNRGGQYADIYVNGNYKLRVPPYQSRWCVLEQRYQPTVLTGYGNEDLTSWGPRYVWGSFNQYTWNLD
jgi:hypothetical protein